MKKSIQKLSMLLGVLFILVSCGDDDKISQTNLQEEGIDISSMEVQTYELVTITFDNNDLKEKYQASFGDQSIDIIKTSDSTLSFVVPNMEAGIKELNFELVKTNFDITKTIVQDPNETIGNIFSNFSNDISEIQENNNVEQQDLEDANTFKDKTSQLFESLTSDQQKEVALHYKANKGLFLSFINDIKATYDAPTTKSIQSNCPQDNFKNFYACTANNLGNSAKQLFDSSKKLGEWISYMAAVGAVGSQAWFAGPAAWGLTAVGATLTTGTAAYLFITEVYPALVDFKSNLKPFLKANWILSQATFDVLTSEFNNETETDLNLDPKLRTINETDTDISSEINIFISSYNSLASFWNEDLITLIGELPEWFSDEESTNLEESDNISISNITNSEVQMILQEGETVTFKSQSGEEETFDFDISVSKEGITKEKTITAIVSAGGGCGGLTSFTDSRDGQTYEVVQIGNQCWMAENLNYNTNSSWCYDDDPNNCNTYGRLYDWQSAFIACPDGWHLPSEVEWFQLLDYLGGKVEAGGKIKSTSSLWESPNTGATNSSGFSGLPGGWRSPVGTTFQNVGRNAGWWSSTEIGSSDAWFFRVLTNSQIVLDINTIKTVGSSCRCLKD